MQMVMIILLKFLMIILILKLFLFLLFFLILYFCLYLQFSHLVLFIFVNLLLWLSIFELHLKLEDIPMQPTLTIIIIYFNLMDYFLLIFHFLHYSENKYYFLLLIITKVLFNLFLQLVLRIQLIIFHSYYYLHLFHQYYLHYLKVMEDRLFLQVN
jgi:hypothetical protein